MRKAAEYTKLAVPIYAKGIKKLHRPEWEEDFAKNLHAIDGDIAEPYDRAIAKALADRDLTEQGRAKAVRKVKQEHLAKVEREEAHLVAPLRTRVASMQAELSKRFAFAKPTDAAERAAFELRQREIRDSLRGLDGLQRLNVYHTLTDAEVREALESAPPVLRPATDTTPAVFEPLVDPSAVESARAARIQQGAPDVVAEMEALTSLANLYASLINEVRAAILEDMPREEPPAKSRPQPTGDAVVDAGLVHAE